VSGAEAGESAKTGVHGFPIGGHAGP